MELELPMPEKACLNRLDTALVSSSANITVHLLKYSYF